jgi:hypothetical protein
MCQIGRVSTVMGTVDTRQNACIFVVTVEYILDLHILLKVDTIILFCKIYIFYENYLESVWVCDFKKYDLKIAILKCAI